MNAGRTPPREVVVRFVRTEAFEDAVLAARAQAVLGADEREALARLRPVVTRRDYLAAHVLARMMLAERTGAEPTRLCIRASRWGRPELVAPPGACRLSFSISHADGIALCAVAAGSAVGADVESLRNVGPDPLGVAEAVCSAREMHAIRALPPSARAERLLALWTLKEAVAKATGLGFHLPLAHIAVDEAGDGLPGVRLGADAADEGSPWRLASWRLAPWHRVAVAVRGAGGDELAIRFAELDPGW